MASAILDIQCIMGANFKYLIKEMSIVDVHSRASQHWIFKHTQTPHTAKSKAVNIWLFRNYHQLSMDCGDVQYSEIDRILKSLHFECIYVKGEEKRQIIQDFIPQVDVIDMGADLDCPRLNQLHQQLDYVNINNNNNYNKNNVNRVKNCKLSFPCCIYHMDLDHSQCTYNRIFALQRWFINNV